MDRLTPLLVLAALSATVPAAFPSPGAIPPDVARYLTTTAKFTDADLANLEAGQVISRVEEGSTKNEMIAIAAVKIASARERVAAYYGQMVAYVDGDVTLGFGKFSTPPSMNDVTTLRLDQADVDALRTCRPGDCDLRIGAAGIATIRDGIEWSAPDAAEKVQQAVRRAVVDYVGAYQARGDAALVTYNDRSKPVSLADEWRGILAGSPYFMQYEAALQEHLTQYPRQQTPGARDILYWVKENFGLKPTVSVVHGVVYEPPSAPGRTTIVQKQIFASHYYDASLAVGTLVDAQDNGRPVTYMVYANRSRGDLLKGGFGGLKRAVARDQARKAAQTTLETMKSALETR